jgi:nitroreductase
MTSLNDTSSALSLLKTRKSASVKAMGEPGPTPEQLKTILEIAVRVPDHGKLTPWRLVLFEGAARRKFGEIIKARWQKLHPDHGAESLNFQAGLFLRAPIVIAIVSKAGPHVKIPEWEQLLSAGALTQNMLLAAAALGVGAQWNTDWIAYDKEIMAAMGLSEPEKIVGFVYFGTPQAALEDRPRPEPESLITRWQG